MIFRARLVGTGTAEVEAYGSGDAEARLEKEAQRAIDGARLSVRAIRRLDEAPRIVESFRLEYRLRVDVALAGTRFERIAWERADLEEDDPT